MSKMKAQTLVDKVVDIAKNHKTLYVMGCFGAPLTGNNVTRYCGNHDYNKAAARTRMIKAAANQSPPVYGFDCVNLIKGVLWGWCGDPSRTYGGAAYPTKTTLAAGACPDVGADSMIKLCKDVSTTGWASMLPGEAVWCSGHIGVYIGNGLAVECSPRWENKVQITAVAGCGKKAGYNTRTWTKHGKLPWVDYAARETEKEDEDMPKYRTLKDVPDSYRPTIRKLMERGALRGESDPDPNSLEDNVLNLNETYCRIMTTLDRLEVLG